MKQNLLVARALPVKPDKFAEDAVMAPASEAESGLIQADLLAAMNRKEQAAAAWDKLSKLYPGSPEIAESMGYAAWQSGDTEAARKYFEQALPGTKDALMCYQLALLYHDAGQGGDKVLATLARAVALKPDYVEARLQLGLADYNRKNYPAAIAALAPIDRMAPDYVPEHAATLYGALANSYAQTGDYAEAKKYLATSRQWNKTDADKKRADELAQYLDGR